MCASGSLQQAHRNSCRNWEPQFARPGLRVRVGLWTGEPTCLAEEEAAKADLSAALNEYPGRTRGAKGINGEKSLGALPQSDARVGCNMHAPADNTHICRQTLTTADTSSSIG